MDRIRSYKELRVYQAAIDAAMRIFEITKRFRLKNVSQWLTKYADLHVQSARTLERRGANAAIRHISRAS